MKFTGSYRVSASRQKVWEAINEPNILRQCIPGCEEIVRETPTDWTAKVVAKVGPVKARFAGKIRLEDLQPPSSSRIVGEGNGGAAGFAKGEALITLTDEGDATRLTYEAEAQIGGKLAQIGSRLIDGFARKYADEFFAKFASIVGEAEAPQSVADVPSAPAGAQTALPAATVTDNAVASAPVAAAAAPVVYASAPAPSSGRGFDSHAFTTVVLALLLVFMTIMFAMKP